MNSIQAPLLSFFSGDLYRQVAKHWGGIGLAYLTVMTIVCSSVGYNGILRMFDTALDQLFSKLPGITIKDSKLSIDKPSPYEIEIATATATEPTRMVFDTSGKMKSLDDTNGAKVLVTADELIMVDQVSGEQRLPFRSMEVKDMELNNETLKTFRHSMDFGLILVMVVVGVLGLFGHFILSLIYGGLCMIISSMTQANLTYGTAVRLSAVAMTPGMIVSALLLAFQLLNIAQLWGIITIPLTLGYLYFACHSVSKDNAAE